MGWKGAGLVQYGWVARVKNNDKGFLLNEGSRRMSQHEMDETTYF